MVPYEVKVIGIPPVPQTGEEEVKEALAPAGVILAVVKFFGAVEIVTLSVVSTSPLLLFPVVTEFRAVHDPATSSPILISGIPLSV